LRLFGVNICGGGGDDMIGVLWFLQCKGNIHILMNRDLAARSARARRAREGELINKKRKREKMETVPAGSISTNEPGSGYWVSAMVRGEVVEVEPAPS
jgi:hypothetical protein